MLVAFRNRHGGALRADFQRFYGLNLDGLGVDYGVLHAAELAAHLPPESATMLAVAGGWSKTDLLLATLIDDFRFYMWAKSGGKAKNRPKPIPRPGVVDESRKRMKDALLLPVDEVKRRLALPRRVASVE